MAKDNPPPAYNLLKASFENAPRHEMEREGCFCVQAAPDGSYFTQLVQGVSRSLERGSCSSKGMQGQPKEDLTC